MPLPVSYTYRRHSTSKPRTTQRSVAIIFHLTEILRKISSVKLNRVKPARKNHLKFKFFKIVSSWETVMSESLSASVSGFGISKYRSPLGTRYSLHQDTIKVWKGVKLKQITKLVLILLQVLVWIQWKQCLRRVRSPGWTLLTHSLFLQNSVAAQLSAANCGVPSWEVKAKVEVKVKELREALNRLIECQWKNSSV